MPKGISFTDNKPKDNLVLSMFEIRYFKLLMRKKVLLNQKLVAFSDLRANFYRKNCLRPVLFIKKVFVCCTYLF